MRMVQRELVCGDGGGCNSSSSCRQHLLQLRVLNEEVAQECAEEARQVVATLGGALRP